MGVYLDKPCLAGLVAVLRSGACRGRVLRWFDGPHSTASASALGRIAGAPRVEGHVAFQAADVVDERGAAQFYRIWEDGRDLVFGIVDRRVADHPLVRRWSDRFDSGSVEQFLAKVIGADLLDRALLVNACEWHAREHSEESPIFFVQRDLWTLELGEYAASRGVQLRQYSRLLRPSDVLYLSKMRRLVVGAGRAAGRRLASMVTGRRRSRPAAGPSGAAVADGRPTVATWYTGRTVTLDRSLRSDIFWMLDVPFEPDRVLIYFDRPDVPAPEGAAGILDAAGARGTAFSPAAAGRSGLPVWTAGARYRAERTKLVRALAADVISLSLRLRPPGPFWVLNLLHFADTYAWWLDFFLANDVKVSVSPYDFTKTYMPKNRALRDAGGVSVSYQWSNLECSSIELSASSDVYAAFGPAYEPVFRANRSRMSTMLRNGYPTDHAFAEVRQRALELRGRLDAAGARYVLTFFDESSSGARASVISNTCATETYRLLLRWVLANDDVGLVFKPGYPRTLRDRIAPVVDLLDRALLTGRCVLMDSGAYVTDRYPCEAAQAADVAVGLLLSGTAALEAHLTGVRTVFLDVERLYDLPAYEWGAGAIVFDSVAALLGVVDADRRGGAVPDGFANLSHWAQGRDAHRDGRAAERLGGYVGRLLQAFDAGAQREDAVALANAWYAEHWGAENVVSWDEAVNAHAG